MITYLYWTGITVAAFAIFYALGRSDRWKAGLASLAIIFFAGWLAYFFYFQQTFVKHYGGVMSISVPDGQLHITATWKDDHLWVENFDPVTNSCHFTEYSRGNLLQGKVTIRNCNPVRTGTPGIRP